MNITGKPKVDMVLSWSAKILFISCVGVALMLWVIQTGKFDKPKPELHPCEKVTAHASPFSTRYRTVPGTSKEQYLECARRHAQIMVKIDSLSGQVRKPIPDEELVRLSKMTQDERDREDCQIFNKPWERWFKKPFENPRLTDPISIKFREDTLAWCEKFK